MSAAKNIHPDQLKMFMSAREIVDTHRPVDSFNPNEDPGSHLPIWSEKRHQAETDYGPSDQLDESLAENIRRTGIQNPVRLHQGLSHEGEGPVLGNGHHRVAVMQQHAPDQVFPVMHHGPFSSSDHEMPRNELENDTRTPVPNAYGDGSPSDDNISRSNWDDDWESPPDIGPINRGTDIKQGGLKGLNIVQLGGAKVSPFRGTTESR